MPWRERIVSLVDRGGANMFAPSMANPSEAECDVALACRGLRGWLNLCR